MFVLHVTILWTQNRKKMYSLDEEKIEYVLETGRFGFWHGKKVENGGIFISDVGIRSIYLSLTLGTAKFKQLDLSWSLKKSYDS